MSLHQQPDLKQAVLSLTPKEKDKLLVRLISKDKMLIKQLHFQLLEDESDLADRIDNLRDALTQLFKTTKVGNFMDLNRLVKQASGMVNEHEKVTKDKISELEFRILILKEATSRHVDLFSNSYFSSSEKLRKYIAGRIKHALGKYTKLHEDLQFEYRDQLQELIDFGFTSGLQSYCRALNIPTQID